MFFRVAVSLKQSTGHMKYWECESHHVDWEAHYGTDLMTPPCKRWGELNCTLKKGNYKLTQFCFRWRGMLPTFDR